MLELGHPLHAFDLSRLENEVLKLATYVGEGKPITEADVEAVSAGAGRVIVPALYCDRVAPPASYPSTLAASLKRGGYEVKAELLDADKSVIAGGYYVYCRKV